MSGMLALSGLASGVDTSSIVEQLMSIERRGLSRLKLNQSRIAARDTGLKDIQAKLNAFKAAAAALREPGLWSYKQTIESSDPTRVSAQLTSGAGIGGTSIIVQGLASSTQRTFDFNQSATDQTIEITPTATGAATSTVNVGANATLDEVVAAINGRSDLPVFAAAVTPAGGGPAQLVLSSRTTGANANSNFTVTGSAVTEDAALYKAGTNARYRLNGSTQTQQSPTNVIENAVPGVTLTLKAVSNQAVTVSVGEGTVDKDGVKAKLKSFVEAYNALVVVTRGKIEDKTVPKAESTADAIKGQLFGDSALSSMLSTMRTAISDVVAGNPAASDALADLGISTGAIGAGKSASSGTLSFDEAKFDALFASNAGAVRTLLGGVATRFEGLVDQQTGSSGLITMRLKSSSDETKRISDAMTRTESRLAEKEKRLKAQFAAMESALQASQTQQAWLSGQLAALQA